MTNLDIKITNEGKSIKDIVSDALECIKEDREIIKNVRQRVSNTIESDTQNNNGQEQDLVLRTSLVGNVESQLLNLQNTSSKNMIELLKVVSKLTETSKDEIANGGSTNVNDLIELYNKIEASDDSIKELLQNTQNEFHIFEDDAIKHSEI